MAAPLGIAKTNSSGVSFVFQNLQKVADPDPVNSNTSVMLLPNVVALNKQAAAQMAGRQPGGTSYLANSNSAYASPSNANATIVQLDAMVTSTADLPYTKNGAFFVTLSGTTNSVIPLTNTQTNTNGFAGDTVFATIKQISFYNLTPLDGNPVNSIVTGKYNTNGLDLGWISGTNGVFNGVTLYAGSRITLENNNGWTVNAANANIYFTPLANSTVGVVVSGS